MCWTYIGIRDIISIMSAPNYNALNASNGSGEAVRATVQAPRSISSTAITVNATTNWPTGTFIATTGTLLASGKLDPTTAQVFYGTASGTTITITSFAAGYTDKGNAIDDVVVIKPTTEWANIVAQGVQSTTQFPANFANFVEPTGGVWSTSSGLIGSQTAGNVWYQGVRSAIPIVATKTFTASKDTYVDFNPATSAFTYVVVNNFAAEPALTASCVRVAKCVTGASAITGFYQLAYTTPRSALTTTNPYKFSVYRNSALNSGSGAYALVSYDTKIYDTGSNIDVVTNKGRFTAPVSGFYHFDASIATGASYTAFAIALFKNGSVFNYGGRINNTNTAMTGAVVTYGDTIQLSAGDYVEIFAFGNAATALGVGSPAETKFSGFLESAT